MVEVDEAELRHELAWWWWPVIYALALAAVDSANFEPWPIGLAVLVPVLGLVLAVRLVRKHRPVLAARLGLPMVPRRSFSMRFSVGFVLAWLAAVVIVLLVIGTSLGRFGFKASWVLLTMLFWIPIYYAACRDRRYWP
ncbi:hypothetical protein [Allokutzneria sp. NRRL B-24872]|uniref:hypothetical protein n=1 Tax=Allokutzneria sp. NRRL B-24872 TaxID=1137961 RepID=UPI000A3AF2D2|nr:hypothetical protein [Allokutzneria sp. NRRL B-24872]